MAFFATDERIGVGIIGLSAQGAGGSASSWTTLSVGVPSRLARQGRHLITHLHAASRFVSRW
jgi:hypothetical protein